MKNYELKSIFYLRIWECVDLELSKFTNLYFLNTQVLVHINSSLSWTISVCWGPWWEQGRLYHLLSYVSKKSSGGFCCSLWVSNRSNKVVSQILSPLAITGYSSHITAEHLSEIQRWMTQSKYKTFGFLCTRGYVWGGWGWSYNFCKGKCLLNGNR